MDKIPELTQKQFEEFMQVLNKNEVSAEKMNVACYAGAVVRAAVQIGWINLDVDNARPHEIQKVNRLIQEYIGEILTVSPN